MHWLLCVSHRTLIIFVGLHWCVRIVPVDPASLSCHSNFAMLGIGSSQPTRAAIRVNAIAWESARQSRSSGLACPQVTSAEWMHSWEPQGCGGQGSPLFPHTFTPLHHPLLLRHPSTPSPFVFCLRKFPAPDIMSPFHMLNSKASQQDHNFLALPIA